MTDRFFGVTEWLMSEYNRYAENAAYSHWLAYIAYSFEHYSDAKRHQEEAAYSSRAMIALREQYQYCVELISR